MNQRILVVEDDDTTASFIQRGLAEAGMIVDVARNGRDGLFQASDANHAAIILDRMLPGMDGLAVLAALRAAGIATPVLMLSALGTPDDRLTGLETGADDYLAKPFLFGELLARLKLLLRHRQAVGAPVTKLQLADLEMDLLSRRVVRGRRVLALQPREFRLLEYLLRHPDQVVTRTMLLEGVWDYHFDPGTNVIDVHVSKLRRKLEEAGEPPLLHTVRGAGYRLGKA